MGTLFQDLRFGLRMLARRPGFTATAVLALALGIGANSTIFNLVNALLLRPLPVVRPDEIVAVYTSDYSSTEYGTSSYPDYVDFRDRNGVFAGLVAYQATPFSLNTGGANERAFGEIVSGNYFTVLGVRPAPGRGFLPEEDITPGAQPVVVISHKLWQQRFGGDPGVVGRIVKLNGHPFTVVGVAPEKYSGLTRGLAADLWVPAMMMEQALPGSRNLVERGSRGFSVMGRLKPGVTLAQAQADFRVIAEQLFKAWPQEWTNIRKESRVITLLPESEARVMPGFRKPLIIFMALLMTVVGLVLLIACANVANLMLARATARRREIAVRLSLGASRGALIRQLLTESLLLSLAGGGVGLLLAAWGADLLMAFKPPMQMPIEIDLRTDWRVLGFTFGISLLTGILFGLAPALAASKPDLVAALKEGEGMAGHGRTRLRGAFVVAQVALSLLLLVGAGLFLRSLGNASAIDPGFDPDNLLAMTMDLQLQGYDRARGKNFSRQLLDRVRAVPGVEAATLAEYLPLNLDGARRGITIEGYTPRPGESTEVGSVTVAPGYFETLRLPVLRGRSFGGQDREGAPGVVMVNEAFARRYWPGQDPLGKRIRMGAMRGGNSDELPALEVIGVVKDGKYVTLGEGATPFFYLNLAQGYDPAPTLIVRTRGNPTDYLPAVRNVVAALDDSLPLFDVKTMREHLGLALLPARLAGTILGIFGLVALVLAASGIYGVMSYSVARRTREIGIRMALGAGRGDVLRLIVGQGMKLVVIGTAIGLVAALALGRLLGSLLYGLSPADPLTFAGMVLLLAGVALAACWIPARRATKTDPMIALRYE
ncbi:MAG TPA: ABC transporter permease [Blastocatellia bacterium]|nr:ABC transporter permease [Blastocatellia bacterium]